MRNIVTAGVVLALAASKAFADEASCKGESKEINGNWYCSAVDELKYDIFGQKGTYMKVTHMDPDTGECTQEEQEYSGPMAPFNEELSFHFRGPFKLKQFAVYNPNPNPKQKRSTSIAHQRRHNHHHFHKHGKHIRDIQHHAQEMNKRAVGDIVYATIDGQVQSWTNSYSGEAPTAAPMVGTPKTTGEAPTPTPAATEATPSPSAEASPSTEAPAESSAVSEVSSSEAPSGSGDQADLTGDWVRSGYYNSADQTLDGMVFLNNKGGQGSGVFDYKFGNSLSYASSNGQNGAPSPQILDGECTLESNTEVILFTDKPCKDNDCGYVRPGTVAYHGFGGAQKAFFMEFQMPDDGKTGSKYDNADMPAVWMLNAQIPHTGQYVKESCSCWKSGCGEFDLFEVLDPGNKRCKSTVHAKGGLGHSNYFDRPVDKTIKVVVMFLGTENVAHIKIINDKTEFPTSMSNENLRSFCSTS